MSFGQAVVLGAVQGLTEFIPISSSGHLVIVPELFGWSQPGLAFDVMLHIASLLALLVYFSGELVDLWRGVRAGDEGSRRMLALLLIGTVPAALAGILLGDFFDRQFENANAAAIQLMVTGIILIAAEQILAFHQRRSASAGHPMRTMEDLRTGDSVAVGIAQAVSILPGISRSGATIGAGLALGVTRDDSARFAFLLAIPALAGAAVVELPEIGNLALGRGAALGGFVASLLTSYGAIAALIRYLKSNSLYPFAAYCLIAGAVFTAVI